MENEATKQIDGDTGDDREDGRIKTKRTFSYHLVQSFSRENWILPFCINSDKVKTRDMQRFVLSYLKLKWILPLQQTDIKQPGTRHVERSLAQSIVALTV